MKKTIISIVLVVLLAAMPALAKSSMENYLSANIGVGFQRQTYETAPSTKMTVTITQLPISISDTVFFDKKSNIGLFLDAGMTASLSAKVKLNDTESDPTDLGYKDGKYPTFFDVTVGAAYRTKAGKLNLLLGAGFELATKSKNYTNFGIKVTQTFMGLALNGSAMLEMGDSLYLQVGAKASLWFVASQKVKIGSADPVKSTQDNYFSWTIAPRVAITYVI